ncbi:hypothetical protein C0J52_25749, partial [Blattella germanica]
FKNWFQNSLIPNISHNSVIVTDNAPYHSVELTKAPNFSIHKAEMQEWLHRHNYQYDSQSTKIVLYNIIKGLKDKFRTYEMDKIAAKYGHTVLRLPPYHCDFNTIEKI